jgi:hypothetical protein
MANFRYVNTQIWKDPWFVELRGPEQQLFLYLLTNPYTNLAGIYEISLREMAFDTSIDQEEIKRIFRDRFTPNGKAFYELGFVVLKNWHKHQALNDNQFKSVVKIFNSLPDWLKDLVLAPESEMYIDFESLSNPSKGLRMVALKEKKRIELELEKKGNRRFSGDATAPIPFSNIEEI